MLNKDFFKKQLERLVTEFECKGFTMTKEKANQWYLFMSDFSEEQMEYAVSQCLKTCSYSPSMADIYKNKKKNDNFDPDEYWENYLAEDENGQEAG